MLYIDKYAYCSPLTNTHPLEKFCFAVINMVFCLASPSLTVPLLILLLTAGILILKGGIPLAFYLKLLLLPFSFLIIGTATVAITLIQNSGSALWAITLFGATLGVTAQSLETAIGLFFKSLGAVSCLYFLSLTTPLPEIISVLRSLKVPSLFLELMSLIYRYIFVLLETADQIYTSQKARLGYSTLRGGYRSLGHLVSNLFISSYQRSLDLYTALEARCYDGELKVLQPQFQFSKKNLAGMAMVELFLLGLLFFI